MPKSHGELIAELSKSLTEQNYNPVVVQNHRLYARTFLDYLSERDMPVATVTPSQVEQYFCHAIQCFRERYGRSPSPRWHGLPHTAICKLLRLARGEWPPAGEIGPEVALRRAICQEYEAWLRNDRGLADETIDALTGEARRFLDWRLGRVGADALQALSILDIDLYLDERTLGLRRISLSRIAGLLRSILRYLHQTGRTPTDLAPHVIGPMLYAYEGVPSVLDGDQIAAVLTVTKKDRSPRGLRDYAVLCLLAIYGLRQGEICRLRLDDIDWHAESLRIHHTKTKSYSHMPLLAAAGEGLLDYLRFGRPRAELREVFIRSCAPYAPMQSVYGVVRRRLSDAGVNPPGKRGPHIFRHARAVEMLRASVPQKIIGDMLGHRSTESTNSYLKLATEDLRAVALDIPGSGVLA